MSELILTDADYVEICQHALTLLRKQHTRELYRSLINDIDIIVELCQQTAVNETDVDKPVIVLIPATVRRESIIALWWFARKHQYDVRIEDKLGPNGEAQIVFGYYLTTDAFDEEE